VIRINYQSIDQPLVSDFFRILHLVSVHLWPLLPSGYKSRVLHDRHTQHLSSLKKDVLRRTETKHGERTKINRHCVWTRDIANSTTSQMMRSCVCTASAHCWNTEAAAGAATIWRQRKVTTRAKVEQASIRGGRWDAILRLNLLRYLIKQINIRPVFHFHLVQRWLMELHEHAPCIPIWHHG